MQNATTFRPLDAGELALTQRDAAFEAAQAAWAALTPAARQSWEQRAWDRTEAYFDRLIQEAEAREDARVAHFKMFRDR